MQVINSHQQTTSAITQIGFLAVVFVMLYGYSHIQQDDNYIFYSYAHNIASGNGYVFNPGEKVNATTSSLYTLLLALAAYMFKSVPSIDLPLIGHLLGAVSLMFICRSLLLSFKSSGASVYPFALPFVFLSVPLLPNSVGMETFLAMMLATVCIQAYVEERMMTAALACSLSVLARPDMMLLAAVIGIHHLINRRTLPPWKAVFVFLVPIATWLIFSYAYFGSVIPSTLSAKLGQTQSGRWGTGLIYLKGLGATSTWHGAAPKNWTVALMLAGLVIFALRGRQWMIFKSPVFHLIIIWNLVYLAVYGLVLNPPAYLWYYTPLSLGIAALATIPFEAFFLLLKRGQTTRPFATWIPLCVVAAVALIPPLKAANQPVTAKYENYKLAAEWLNSHVKAGSNVGANEIGVLRYYYKNGQVIDGLGLTTPEVAIHVKQQDYSWYISKFKPDYLMFNHPYRPTLEAMVEDDWFKKEYGLKTIISTPRRAVAIYERQTP